MRRSLLCTLTLTLALAGGCTTTVQNPVSGQMERTVMDVPTEIATGKEQHQQVIAEYGVVKDQRLQAYVNGIGQRLAKHSERSELEWHFTVLDSPEVNAFALPGGYVYVTRGIMAYMESEADLAGVMGHEIGHVSARHGAQRATRQQTAGFGVLAATVLGAILEGRGVSGAGQMASELSQNVAAGYIAHYSREQESQADRLGAEYLSRAGYDPQHMVRVIEALKDQERFAADLAREQGREPRQGNDWLASHPSNDQRLQDIEQIAAQYPQVRQADDGRTTYLQMINGLAFGESADQGLTRGRNFYHEPLDFAITAPEGWQIQNEPSALALVSPGGDAGLVLHVVPPKAGSTPDEILRNVLKPQTGSLDHYEVNGFPAAHFIGTGVDTQGNAQPVEATVISGPSSRNYLLLYSAADASVLARSRAQMRQAEESFRRINASERASVHPWHLRTVPYPRGGFAELARQSPVPHAERQLRLLNGVYASGEPKPGQLVKVVE